MKSLSDPAVEREVLSRILTVSSDDERRWGSMSARQMICHLSDAYLFALDRKKAGPLRSPLPKPLFKWLALRVPLQWPQGFKAPPEIAQDQQGTPPGEFERDRKTLIAVVEEFCRRLPQPCSRHPYFGAMSEQDWRRWGYLHADHHLRQFGR